MEKINRRSFLKSSAGIITAAGFTDYEQSVRNLLPVVREKDSIEKRKFGKTGFFTSLLGFGAAQIGDDTLTDDQADEILRKAIESGINFVDTSPLYGFSEQRIGRLPKIDKENTLIATKTFERSGKDAQKSIDTSLKKMKIEQIGLMQLHSVNTFEDIEAIFGPEGALQALVISREAGKIKYIGITGHTRFEVIAKAIDLFDFDSVMIPLSAPDYHYYDFAELIDTAVKKEIAVIAMKVFAAGNFVQDTANALNYTLTYPVSSAVVGMKSLTELEQNIISAKHYKPLSLPEKIQIRESAESIGIPETLWWKNRNKTY